MTIVLSAVIAYVLGSLNFSIILSKFLFRQDIREGGSGNAGATNMARRFGKAAGLLTLIGEMLKAAASLFLGYLLAGELGMAAAGPSCQLGHCFPAFYRFKGGKGVATYCGIAIGTCWGITIIGAIVFFVVLKIKKYVSLASISTVWTGWFLALLWNIFITTKVLPIEWFGFITYGNTLIVDWVFVLYLAIASALVTYRHHGNISRVLKGEERKITWM